MTATTLKMTFDALPKKAQSEVIDFVEYISHKYSSMSVKKHKLSKNPSPSGDVWFENPKNLKLLEEAINDNNYVTEENSPVIQELFAKYGSKKKVKTLV